MEGVGAAASVLAIIDASAQVAKVVFKYTRGVLKAKEEIYRLRDELENLSRVAESLHRLLEGPNGSLMRATTELEQRTRACHDHLGELQKRLGKVTKVTFLRSLQWPLRRQETEDSINLLARWREVFSQALLIDQRYVAEMSPQPQVCSAAATSSYPEALPLHCLAFCLRFDSPALQRSG